VVIVHNECTSLEDASKNQLRGYVLTQAHGKNITDSGVRIGNHTFVIIKFIFYYLNLFFLGPLNLKFETKARLNKYSLGQALVLKLSPYLGLSGKKAIDALESKPLNITQSEFDIIEKKVKEYYLPKIKHLPKRIKSDKRVHICV
jgi:hypothetical protein